MLITVGVLLDTMRQIETYLLQRHYDGFLNMGKLRGRSAARNKQLVDTAGLNDFEGLASTVSYSSGTLFWDRILVLEFGLVAANSFDRIYFRVFKYVAKHTSTRDSSSINGIRAACEVAATVLKG